MTSRQNTQVALLALVIPALLLFARTIKYPYVTFDDAIHIYRNPWMGSFWSFWKSSYEGLYIPVSYSLWTLGAKLAQIIHLPLDRVPFIFHTMNLVVHLTNGILVFHLLRKLGLKHWGAWVGSALFLLHPIQVESVAWISAFREILFVFFGLLATHCYLKERPLALFIFYLLSILSKPAAIVLPFLFLMLHFRPLSLLTWVGLFGVGIFIVWLTQSVQPAPGVIWWQRPIVAFDAFIIYLTHLVFPWNLSSNYGRTVEVAIHSKFYLLGTWLVLAAFVFGRRRFFWGLFWIWLATLPTSGLIPFTFQKYSTVADRYFYLAMIGVAIYLGKVADLFSKRWQQLVVLVALTLYFGGAQNQLRHWQDDTSVVAQVARTTENADHRYNLAQMIAAEMEGMAPVPGLAPRALFPPQSADEKQLWLKVIELNCLEAIRLRWEFPEAWGLLGATYHAEGKWVDAVAALQTAIQQKTNYPEAKQTLALIFRELRRPDLL